MARYLFQVQSSFLPLKDLIDDEADIVPSSLYVTQLRSAAVDFITPFQLEMNSFFIATQSSSYYFDIFHKSFSLQIWITLFIVIIITSFMIFFVAWKGQEKYIKVCNTSRSLANFEGFLHLLSDYTPIYIYIQKAY